LLSQYQPRIIKTEEENEIFLEIVEGLLSSQNLTPEEDALLELLVKLIDGAHDLRVHSVLSCQHFFDAVTGIFKQYFEQRFFYEAKFVSGTADVFGNIIDRTLIKHRRQLPVIAH